MSLKEKIEAVLKNNQAISTLNQDHKVSNQELNAPNEYIRRQLGDFVKQKQKVLASPTGSIRCKEDEAATNLVISSIEGEPLMRGRRE